MRLGRRYKNGIFLLRRGKILEGTVWTLTHNRLSWHEKRHAMTVGKFAFSMNEKIRSGRSLRIIARSNLTRSQNRRILPIFPLTVLIRIRLVSADSMLVKRPP